MRLRKLGSSIIKIPGRAYNRLVFLYRKVMYDTFPKIEGRVYIVCSPLKISFGKNVRINSSLRSNPIGGSTRTILFAKPEGVITIGDNVGISNSCIFASQKVTIGNNVLIGGDCKIYDTDFHSVYYNYRMEKPDTHVKSAPISIGDGVFIGAHSIILKGVTIGERSVIAAGSIVTNDIPPNQLWGEYQPS